jgi:hypothetical protein
MRLVRYADDFLLTFERRGDADRMATALAERLAKFGLRLHEDKTQLIEFGRFAATNRRAETKGRAIVFWGRPVSPKNRTWRPPAATPKQESVGRATTAAQTNFTSVPVPLSGARLKSDFK